MKTIDVDNTIIQIKDKGSMSFINYIWVTPLEMVAATATINQLTNNK